MEKFVGALRSYERRYVTPTCWQTEGVYKSLLVNNLVSKHFSTADCLDDKGMIQKQPAENKSPLALLCRIQSAGNFAKTILKQVQGIKSC